MTITLPIWAIALISWLLGVSVGAFVVNAVMNKPWASGFYDGWNASKKIHTDYEFWHKGGFEGGYQAGWDDAKGENKEGKN